MEKRKTLGRGLEALLPVPEREKKSQHIVNINVIEISSNRYQPRQNFTPQLMQKLMASIKEKGLIQPLLVREVPGGYELIAGERRLRAAKELGLLQVPAIIKDIKENADLIEIALIENLQREDLNPIEEAQAFKRLKEGFGLSYERIGQIAGKEPVTIVNTLRLLKLPLPVQEKISQRELTEGHGRAILSIEDPQTQINFAEQIIRYGLSVREAENRAKKFQRKKAVPVSGVQKKEPQLVAWEEELQHIFGTKVGIIQRRSRGKIELEYYSLADLERLINLLKKVKT